MEANAMKISAKFENYPSHSFLGVDIWLLSSWPFFDIRLPWQKGRTESLHKNDRSHRRLIEEHFCKEWHQNPEWRFVDTKSALKSPVVYATDRSQAMVLVFFLLCVALCVLLRRVSVESCLALYSRVYAVLVSIVITSLLGIESWSMCLSCTYLFILHALISVLFLFLLVSWVSRGLWLWHSLDFSINLFVKISANCHFSHNTTLENVFNRTQFCRGWCYEHFCKFQLYPRPLIAAEVFEYFPHI